MNRFREYHTTALPLVLVSLVLTGHEKILIIWLSIIIFSILYVMFFKFKLTDRIKSIAAIPAIWFTLSWLHFEENYFINAINFVSLIYIYAALSMIYTLIKIRIDSKK